jgi:5-methyltetrahydrofolate--homocysteine methyltransferase
MPIGAIGSAGTSAFRIVRRCREELGVNTCCGASNVSFGLPGREMLNAAFLAMVMTAGMPCAITNPLIKEITTMIKAADVMMGNDLNCEQWILANREESDDDVEARRAERRKRRRDKSS